MNSALMATSIAADRDIPAFDFNIGNSVVTDSAASATSSASVGLPMRRGLMSMMKGMVGLRDQDSAAGVARVTNKEEVSTKLDAKSYAARWRTTKLVVFDLVRGNIPITTTSTTTSSAANAALHTTDSSAGNALYRIRRHKERRKSVIGDKLKKLRALQSGVVRKIGWLPEWWWDILPPIDLSAELGAFDDIRMSDMLDCSDVSGDNQGGEGNHSNNNYNEITLLDEAEDPFQKDTALSPHLSTSATAGAGQRMGYDVWRWLSNWDNSDWMPDDMVSPPLQQLLLEKLNNFASSIFYFSSLFYF